MEKKVALVIGGSGGIGSEVCKVLNKKGMKICLGYFQNKKVESNYDSYKVDINQEKDVINCINKVIEENKKIDVVVYCVSAPVLVKRFDEVEWKDFQEHINLQIRGFLTLVKAMYPLIKGNNNIKFITTLTEFCIGKPPGMLSHYVTAKYGLMGLTKSLSSELSRYNCTFNMVSPGMTNTNLISNLPKRLIEITANNNPLRRIAEPNDVAKVISFLASEESDYLNGVNILINGGNIFI